jgi:hypothetical protein
MSIRVAYPNIKSILLHNWFPVSFKCGKRLINFKPLINPIKMDETIFIFMLNFNKWIMVILSLYHNVKHTHLLLISILEKLYSNMEIDYQLRIQMPVENLKVASAAELFDERDVLKY